MCISVVRVGCLSKVSVILPAYRVHPHVKNTSHTFNSVKLDSIIPFSCIHDGVIILDCVLFEISQALKTRKMQIKWLIDTCWGYFHQQMELKWPCMVLKTLKSQNLPPKRSFSPSANVNSLSLKECLKYIWQDTWLVLQMHSPVRFWERCWRGGMTWNDWKAP